MANKISEQLFEAMDVLIGKRMLDAEKDKTILCTIEDASNASAGEYTVSNASARFTAYSENTKYRAGQNVWVLIPDGDYNNDKIIISKYTKDSSSPFVYVDPMDTFIDMTGNVLADADEEVGLLANCDYPVCILPSGYNENDEPQYDKIITDEENRTRLPISDDNILPIKLASLNVKTQLLTGESHIKNSINMDGYTKIGVKADFKTAFGSTEPVTGSYGLMFILRTQKEVDVARGVTEIQEFTLPFMLDTSMMWGNPYAYTDYFTQSAVFDLDAETNGTPVGIECYFYQNFDFFDGEGNVIPYVVQSSYNTGNSPIEEVKYEYLPPNIFVSNISVSFGESIDDIDSDTLRLYTKNNLTYAVNNGTYTKTLNARYIYVSEDQTERVVIDNMATFANYLNQISTLQETKPMIRWFRKRMYGNITDFRAGDLWEELYPVDAKTGEATPFSLTVDDLDDPNAEYFKCLLCYNPQLLDYLAWALKSDTLSDNQKAYYQKWYEFYGGTNPEESDYEAISEDEWASVDRIIESNILTFTNQDASYDLGLDVAYGLTLTPIDSHHGVFNIYEASMGADNRLIDGSEEVKPKLVKAVFNSVLPDEGLNEVDRLAWYIPKRNTMIKAPVEGKNYNCYTAIELDEYTYDADRYYVYNDGIYNHPTGSFDTNTIYYMKGPDYCFTSLAEINDYTGELTDEERELFASRINDYYIILETDIVGKGERLKASFLSYFIKPKFIKIWTNNTIYASAYRYKAIYEGENAHFTPTFGVKGTNGTDYTLLLTTPIELKGAVGSDSSTWVKENYPSAWTRVNSAEDTHAIQLSATLFDANDQVVEDAVYAWKIVYQQKVNEAISDNGDWLEVVTNSINGLGGPWLTSTLTSNSDNQFLGIILQCTASIQIGQNQTEVFSNYMIIPVRNTRSMIALQGPSIVRYDSAGINPQYFNEAYALIDFDGKIDYTFSDNTKAYYTNIALAPYLPELKKQSVSNKYKLVPRAMYFNDVTYDYAILFEQGDAIWTQPILILVDPYGNTLLNSWSGDLVIDKTSNTIMSSIIGAGKKESDNTFTGLLAGDLPKVESLKHTGILGYEHGEQSYGLLDDGTLFLGKSSRAQIRLDGSNGYIKNTGWDNGSGINIDFGGNLSGTAHSPYISLKAHPDVNTGTEVRIGTTSPYFQITSSSNKDLIKIANNEYFLQTDNYSVDNGTGLRINLQDGTFDSRGKLTITGDSNSTINFGDGKLVINGDGTLTAAEFNFINPDSENLTIAARHIKPHWMSFVTNVEGAYWTGPAGVDVSGTQDVSYQYPGYTKADINATLQGHAKALDALHFVSSPNLTVNNFTPLPDEGGYNWFTANVTAHGVVSSEFTATGIQKNVQFTGHTTVDVVQGIKLRITKVSMWALTNDDVVTEQGKAMTKFTSTTTTPPPGYTNF